MPKALAVVVMAGVGCLVGMQAPINSVLGKSVGSLQAAVVSFVVGTIALAGVTLIAGGGFASLPAARHLSWIYFVGGLLGALWVISSLILVRHIGAGAVTAATIAGQLTIAVVIDQLGIFGVPRHPIEVSRIAGIALLAGGTYLVIRG